MVLVVCCVAWVVSTGGSGWVRGVDEAGMACLFGVACASFGVRAVGVLPWAVPRGAAVVALGLVHEWCGVSQWLCSDRRAVR